MFGYIPTLSLRMKTNDFNTACGAAEGSGICSGRKEAHVLPFPSPDLKNNKSI